jgi:hypothetical protein
MVPLYAAPMMDAPSVRKKSTRAAEYRQRAQEAADLALASPLDNVRERHEQAAAKWLAMAETDEDMIAKRSVDGRTAASPAP